MPKMKTHKGAKRRFKMTGSGKFVQPKGMKSHFRRRKATRVKQQFDKMSEVHETNVRMLKVALPYGV